MPVFAKTVSFRSQFVFNPSRDDPVLGELLAAIQAEGGRVLDVKVSSAGNFGAFVATYLVTYEASAPLDVAPVRGGTLPIAIILVLAGLAVAGVAGLILAATQG